MRSSTFFAISSLMVAVAVGCGEPFSATGPGGSGSSTSSGGTGGGGGSSSSGGGGGGMPCTVGDLSSCAMGEYCMDGATPTCAKCYDFTHFAFGAPKKLDVALPSATMKSPSYPRIGVGGELFFTYLLTGGTANLDLGHADAASFPKWMTATALNMPPNTSADDAGPLYLPKATDFSLQLMGGKLKLDSPVLMFHSNTGANPMQEQIYAMNIGGADAEQVMLPNAASAPRNYNIAVATDANPVRIFYVSNINNSNNDEIVTWVPSQSMMYPTPYSPTILIKTTCGPRGDLTPWVTPAGNWLLFSSPDVNDQDPKCPALSGPSHLYYINFMGAKPTAPQAQQIFPNDTTADRTTPSMSPDLCTIYYTERGNGTSNMYAAIRQ